MPEPSPRQGLLDQLQQLQPKSLLVCTRACAPAIQDWCDQHQCALTVISASHDWEALGRFDCVIVADWIEHHSREQAMQQLARLRNLHTHAIWLLLPGTGVLPQADILALGFHRLALFPSAKLESYGYNLDNYNHHRQWNSPKYWANPENWGKYWW